MKKNTILFRSVLIAVSFCLLNIICIGQTKFEDQTLNFLNEVAEVTTLNQLESLILKKKFVFIEKTELENMGEALVYEGGWGQEIMIAYTKEKKLVFATEQIASITQVFIKMELKKNGFQMLSTTVQKDEDGNI